MDTYHLQMVSTSSMVVNITRKAHDYTDAMEQAFEEACAEPGMIRVIEIDLLEEEE